jgi:hypothetical protein
MRPNALAARRKLTSTEIERDLRLSPAGAGVILGAFGLGPVITGLVLKLRGSYVDTFWLNISFSSS